MRRVRWLAIATVLALVAPSTYAADRPTGLSFATRSEVLATRGMAASSQPLATETALRILREGGTAVDAAIGANAVLGVVEPMGCGIGGDLFAIVWDPGTRRLHGLNASGPSPMGLTLDWFREHGYDRIPSRGPLSVSVPGAVGGWVELHRRFGRLELSKILEPAIAYARDGYPVSEVIAWGWAQDADLAGEPGFAETFLPEGRAPSKGALFRNPRLAESLQRVAEGGRDGFYQGETAEAIDAFMREHGGFLRASDLAAYQPKWVEPISTRYRGYDVWELPPNGQGLAVLQMLNILEAFDLRALGSGSAEVVHLMVEAKKLVYEDRARYYADPDFASVPVERLISKAYGAERAALIDPEHAATHVAPGLPVDGSGETVYLTVADGSGTMVSLIQSNFSGFGSGVTPPVGFALQNRGKAFSLDPASPNVFAPGKRPFNTIIPGFVTKDGEPWLSFGVMGGDMQPQGQVQVLVNLIDFGMNLQEAGDAPRFNHSGSSEPGGRPMNSRGGVVHLESGYDGIREAVRERGHVLGETRTNYGGYQAIGRAGGGVFVGASESRKDGMAAGF